MKKIHVDLTSEAISLLEDNKKVFHGKLESYSAVIIRLFGKKVKQ